MSQTTGELPNISVEQQQSDTNVNWLRRVQFVAGPIGGGKGIDLSELRITFRVTGVLTGTPVSLKARIYNLSNATTKALLAMSPNPPSPAQFSAEALFMTQAQIILNAGWFNGPFGNIFQGGLVQVRAGRENQTDTYVDIYAQDGDLAHYTAMSNSTLAAGHTPKDQYDAICKDLDPYGIKGQPLPDNVVQNPAPRGKAIFGNTRCYMEDLARSHLFTWNIDKGQMVPLAYESFRGGGNAVKLTAISGLIGQPELTDQGLSVRSLLNPIITWGTRIQINNRVLGKENVEVPGQAESGSTTINVTAPYSTALKTTNWLALTDTDGDYKVLYCDHFGDTRGNEWYTQMICISLDATKFPAQAAVGGFIPPP
jgi:hypothetical protein